MPKFKRLPPLERLNELLEVVEIPEDKYGEWSGLIWKVSRGTKKATSVVGCLTPTLSNPDRFNWVVTVNRINYYASRVIYYMAYGEDPGDAQVDHEDKNWLNNNACNLRLDVDGSIQQVNVPTYRNNTSGVMGVHWSNESEKWRAYITSKRKRTHLGYFTCKVEAARAIRDKWIELGWHELGRKLPDLDKVECGCHHCAPHNF